MSASRPAPVRLQNPSYEIKMGVQRAERGLAEASTAGFRELCPSVRNAVIESERLVVVLDRLVRQGLRRPGSGDPVAAADVKDAVKAVRQAVGRLAETTPAKFSDDYTQYNQRVRTLITVARSVLDRGLQAPPGPGELDEWQPFREP